MKRLVHLLATTLMVTQSLWLTGCGGGASGANNLPAIVAAVLAVFAGTPGIIGSADGTGAAARFDNPAAVAVDGGGNVYVADRGNETVRKVTAAGVVTTLAGTAGARGSLDGAGAAARFASPAGIAVDGSGNVFVLDSGNSTIRKITPAGVVTTLAGTAGVTGSADGTGAAASFQDPASVATDGAGNVYVADRSNHTIRKITPAGVVTTLAGLAGVAGTVDATGANARFENPTSVTTDGVGNVYVSSANSSGIRMITPAGVVTSLGSTSAGAAPSLAADAAGTVYVSDRFNHYIGIFTPPVGDFELAGTGNFQGEGSADGTGAAASFNSPAGIAIDNAGNVYVADVGNHSIRKITPAGVVSTLAGPVSPTGSNDGDGQAAQFRSPNNAATDTNGNLYVVDTANHTVRKITPTGQVSTFAGTARATGSADGTGAAARFFIPLGIAVDGAGNVYVSDAGNDTIRKITPAGVVSTLAGVAGVTGSADGTGAAAQFNRPSGLATDSAGNVYVADSSNATIRRISPAGVVTTLAGTAGMGGSTDGTGAAARFGFPDAIAIGSDGNLLVTDATTIRKVTPAGVVTTLAGSASESGSTDGSGTAARFGGYLPGIAIDGAGNAYVGDTSNYTVRRIAPDGTVTTFAGVAGIQGSTIGSLPGLLNGPEGLAINGSSLYIVMNNGVAVVRNIL